MNNEHSVFRFKVEAGEYVLQEDGQLHQVNRLAGENNVSILEQIQSVQFVVMVPFIYLVLNLQVGVVAWRMALITPEYPEGREV